MFKKINRLIPIFDRYNNNLTRFLINNDLYKFINNKVYDEVKVQRLTRSPKIPYHKQWESRDFYRKNAK